MLGFTHWIKFRVLQIRTNWQNIYDVFFCSLSFKWIIQSENHLEQIIMLYWLMLCINDLNPVWALFCSLRRIIFYFSCLITLFIPLVFNRHLSFSVISCELDSKMLTVNVQTDIVVHINSYAGGTWNNNFAWPLFFLNNTIKDFKKGFPTNWVHVEGPWSIIQYKWNIF